MKPNGSIADRITHFFSSTLWEIDPDLHKGIKRYYLKSLQVMTLVIKNFWADRCLLRASALSYTTILSVVPFFALTFAILKGLGVHNMIEPLVLRQITAGYQGILNKIITYINNTNMTSLGAIGLATLILTVISLLGNIEEAFNVIWGVRETRSIYRKFSDYLSVLVSGPLLLLAATSITTTLESQSLVQWLFQTTYVGEMVLSFFKLLPYVSIWIALFFLYVFIPNTKVHLKSALIGGILAGTVWQVVQYGYITFQIGVAKYNAIYGTLAMLPIFMFWIYTSWIIVLFGVEVVCAHQNKKNFRREINHPFVSQAQKEMLALAILRNVAEAFNNARPPWTLDLLSEELNVPVRVARELMTQLIESGYVVATAGDEPSYLPAREPQQMKIKDILADMRKHGENAAMLKIVIREERIRSILSEIEDQTAKTLDEMNLNELLGPAKPETDSAGSNEPASGRKQAGPLPSNK